MLKPSVLCFLLLFSGTNIWAKSSSSLPEDYYGDVNWNSSEDLKTALFNVISKSHHPVGYKTARQHLFGSITLQGNSPATYNIEAYYCRETLTNNDFKKSSSLGPMKIPDNNILNAEHSWPQSKFTHNFSTGTQKGDLQILFPVRSHVNSTRGNFPFGEVTTVINQPCSDAVLGRNSAGQTVFEPGDYHKGDFARAIFYYSVRYKAKVDSVQEDVLRAWHKADPVDASEIHRNNAIFEIQNNRNPFIDDPSLVDEVSDF